MQEKSEQSVIFSARLSSLMENSGADGRAVAEGTGLTPTAISYYKNGKRLPGAAELRKLAEFFGVSMESFFLNREENKARSQARIKVLETIVRAEGGSFTEQQARFQELLIESTKVLDYANDLQTELNSIRAEFDSRIQGANTILAKLRSAARLYFDSHELPPSGKSTGSGTSSAEPSPLEDTADAVEAELARPRVKSQRRSGAASPTVRKGKR